MRTPSLALYTALPLFAIATAAQANEELTISVIPTEDNPDVATQNQEVVAPEVAAIPIPIQPAARAETPEFTTPEPLAEAPVLVSVAASSSPTSTATSDQTGTLELEVFASHGELDAAIATSAVTSPTPVAARSPNTPRPTPALEVVAPGTADTVKIAAIATKTPKPVPTLAMAETVVDDLAAPINAIAPVPPTPESLQMEEAAAVEPPTVELTTDSPAIELPIVEPLVTEAFTTELPTFERLATPPAASELIPTAVHEPEFAEDATLAVNPEPDCTAHLPKVSGDEGPVLVAQAFPSGCYEPEEIEPVEAPKKRELTASPALSIYIPVGYGADQNTAFLSTNYQSAVRPDADGSTFNGGFGVGLGNAAESVGVEVSYALANNEAFGEGGFNLKLHRQLPDDWAIAAGWNGFLNIGRNDFEHSKYGVVTKVLRLKPSLDDPLSRLSVTAGIGDNQFRSNGSVQDGENNLNLFGNMALRVARPVSFIAEWTGQDLGLGLSIAPFKRVPLTITPAVRDLITTNGRATRFVLGVGTTIQF